MFKKSLAVLFAAAFLFTLVKAEARAEVSQSKDAAMELQLLAQNDSGNLESEQPADLSQSSDGSDDTSYRRGLRRAITEESPEEEKLPLTIETYGKFMPKTTVKGADGKVGLVDTSTELGYEFKVFEKMPVEVALETQYVGIDNSTPTNLPARLTNISTKIDVTLPFFMDKTYLRLGVSPGFFSDDWNTSSESFRIPSRSFVIYQPSKEWTFILGAAFFPRYEGSLIVPVGGLIYKPNDKLTFNLVPSEPTITYSLNDKLDLFLKGEWSSDEFAVKNNITSNDLNEVVLQYKQVLYGAGIAYDICKNVNIQLSGGFVGNRALKYRDSLGKVSLKDGYYSECRVDIAI